MPSPIIRTACTDCGQVNVTPADVTLARCINNAALTTYSFTCPKCKVPQTRDADAKAVAQLALVGVTLAFWAVPLEALEEHAGPVITDDDVLDFALADLDAALASLAGGAK